MQSFKQYLIESIDEARRPELKYTAKAKKGGKELEKGDPKIARIETAISNNDLPGNLGSVFGSLAAAKKKLAEAKKEYEGLDAGARENVKEWAKEIFDEADDLFTRVIETASTLITINKATERSTLNAPTFKKLLKEYFVDSADVIEELAQKATKTTKVASSVKIEPKNESLEEGALDKLKALGASIKASFAKLKAKITGVNKKGKDLIAMAKDLAKGAKKETVEEAEQYPGHKAQLLSAKKFLNKIAGECESFLKKEKGSPAEEVENAIEDIEEEIVDALAMIDDKLGKMK